MKSSTPIHWIKCQLSQFICLHNGYAFESKYYQKHGIPLVRISNLTATHQIVFNEMICVKDKPEYQNFVIKKGDLLLAMSGATTGKLAIYDSSIKVFQNQRVGNLKISKNNVCYDKFRNYLFFSLSNTILKLAYGGAQPNISSTKLLSLSCALPPMAEQKRIVQKIEELFGVIDRDIQHLTDTLEQLSQFRQIFIKKVIYATKNHIPKKKLEQCVKYEQPTKYIVTSTDYVEAGIPVLTPGKTFILGYTNEKNGIFEKPLPVIIFDDFTTATKLVNFPFKVKSSAMKILIALENIDIRYVFYAMQELSCTHDTHKRYWISSYSKLEIPVPSLPEQQKIVNEIEKAFRSADKVQKAVQNALEEAKKLKQSILKKAFAGELVPQDPNDKPVNLPELKGQTK